MFIGNLGGKFKSSGKPFFLQLYYTCENLTPISRLVYIFNTLKYALLTLNPYKILR